MWGLTLREKESGTQKRLPLLDRPAGLRRSSHEHGRLAVAVGAQHSSPVTHHVFGDRAGASQLLSTRSGGALDAGLDTDG